MNIIASLNPRISVIIPVYNTEGFLRQCLDSVTKQPMRDLEIICVNDGSTDGSGEILDEYAENDNRIQVIHQENKGNGIARNVGMDVAIGEYIHFLDSDDFLVDGVYEDVFKIAQEHELDYLYLKAFPIDAISENPIGGFTGDYYSLRQMEPRDYEVPFTIFDRPEVVASQVLPPWGGLHRRELLDSYSIKFPDLRSTPDQFFYIAVVSHAKRLLVADNYAVYYRMNNPGSVTGMYGKNPENHIKAFNLINEQCQFLPKHILNMILKYQLKIILIGLIAQSIGENADNDSCLMRNFIYSLDISELTNNAKNETWYRDYLILKLDIGRKMGILSLSDEKRLVDKLDMWAKHALPLHGLQQTSRIVLYGAGYHGIALYKYIMLSKCCEVALWVDKDWAKHRLSNLPISSPEDIATCQFDYVFITIEKPEIVSEVKSNLVNSGVPCDKILSA